jgi:membrane associated rhomboid family serine protease
LNGRGYNSGGAQFGPPITPPIVKQLMIANAVVFVAQFIFGRSFDLIFSVTPAAVWQAGYLWQPFTYMWLHGTFMHIAMNMFVLWMFGSPMALAWGPKRFLRYYLMCGFGAGFIIASWPYIGYVFGTPGNLVIPTLGASGAVYGLVLAYSVTWPERTIMLIFPPVAFKAIWLIPAMFFMTLMSGAGNVSHLGHLGGVLVGWLLLQRDGRVGNPFTLESLKYRWRRHRMKQKLRAVQYKGFEARRRQDDEHNDNDRRYH